MKNNRGGINIRFNIQESQRINLDAYNIKGQFVRSITDDIFEKGDNLVMWDAKDNSGRNVSSGIYFIKCESLSQVTITKIAILKGE